jgi:hypothetical protein
MHWKIEMKTSPPLLFALLLPVLILALVVCCSDDDDDDDDDDAVGDDDDDDVGSPVECDRWCEIIFSECGWGIEDIPTEADCVSSCVEGQYFHSPCSQECWDQFELGDTCLNLQNCLGGCSG